MSTSRIHVRVAPGNLNASFQQALSELTADAFASRLFSRDATLFGGDESRRAVVANRLGWLSGGQWLKSATDELNHFALNIRHHGTRHVVLLGMGGSSLCPEVLSLVFKLPDTLVTFAILDSTDPHAVGRVESVIDLESTLFIVASKSGSTVETRSQAAYFLQQVSGRTQSPGDHFVAITDSGSSLESWATSNSFHRVFINPSDIGGRYSALSYFGMVAGAILELPLADLAQVAVTESESFAEDTDSNPALRLGAMMAAAARRHVDKLTFVASPELAPVVPWVEQLLAESTGKQGQGVIPIEAEPEGPLAGYGSDRLFCLIRSANESPSGLQQSLAASGRPCVEIVAPHSEALAGLFLLWECSTAAVGALLDINPFDEPNVKESKDNTATLLERRVQSGSFDTLPVSALSPAFELTTSTVSGSDVDSILTALVQEIKNGDYLSFLYYGEPEAEIESALQMMRSDARHATGVATLRGYGPRYLHSIGQLYKGGPQKGHFILFCREVDVDRQIPGAPYSFGTLLQAQARGDYKALDERQRPTLWVQLKGDPRRSLAKFAAAWHTVTSQVSV